MANVFFTSDLHFNHERLLGFRSEVHKKLFPTVSHMNEWIVDSWNSVVNERDLVWVLGDVGWHGDVLEWVRKLNGTKNLIFGNHDKFSLREYRSVFNRIHGCWKKYGVVLTHAPIHPQELQHRWVCNMHGHIHHKERDIEDPRYLNVNIDVRGPVPMELSEVRDYCDRLETSSKDRAQDTGDNNPAGD